MSDPPNDPSIAPAVPPMPVIAIAPWENVERASNFGQHAARASYAAPLAALVLGIYAISTDSDGAIGPVIVGIGLLLILAGLVLGVAALAGTARWGREKVLAPAIVGLTIGSLMLALVVMLVPSQLRARTTAQARRAAAIALAKDLSDAQNQKYGEFAYLADGWFGTYSSGGVVIAINVMPADSVNAKGMHATMPYRFAAVSMRNRTASAIDVNLQNAMLYFRDGAVVTGLDQLAIANTPIPGSRMPKRTIAKPYHIIVGQDLINGLYFFPDDTDFHRLDHLTLRLDDQTITINGRFMTTAEKKKLPDLGR